MPFLEYVDLKNVYHRLYTEYIHLWTYKFSLLLWILQALQSAQSFLEMKGKGFCFVLLILSLGMEVGSNVVWTPVFDKLPLLLCCSPGISFLSFMPF